MQGSWLQPSKGRRSKHAFISKKSTNLAEHSTWPEVSMGRSKPETQGGPKDRACLPQGQIRDKSSHLAVYTNREEAPCKGQNPEHTFICDNSRNPAVYMIRLESHMWEPRPVHTFVKNHITRFAMDSTGEEAPMGGAKAQNGFIKENFIHSALSAIREKSSMRGAHQQFLWVRSLKNHTWRDPQLARTEVTSRSEGARPKQQTVSKSPARGEDLVFLTSKDYGNLQERRW